MKKFQISLSAARVNAGLTQEEVSAEMHISKTTLVNWEKGKVAPSFASLQVLSNLYSIPIDNIFLPPQST